MGGLAKEVEDVFAPGGVLARHLGDRYSVRDEQVRMARFVADVFENRQIGIVEAGTGVGKSFAYLVPSLLLAAKKKQRVIIATNKINLQHQLVEKDLPALLQATGLKVSYILLKGRTNYLSRRRLVNAMRLLDPGLFDEKEMRTLSLIHAWAKETHTGDRAELERVLEKLRQTQQAPEDIHELAARVWPEIQSDRYDCRKEQCPHFRDCFFYKARATAENADIIITNQHVFVYDHLVQQGARSEARVLPDYNFLVIDEAHSLVETVTSCLQEDIDADSIPRVVRRIVGPSRPAGERNGLLPSLLEKLADDQLAASMNDRLKSLLNALAEEWRSCFQDLEHLVLQHSRSRDANQGGGWGSTVTIPYPFSDNNANDGTPVFDSHLRIFELQNELRREIDSLTKLLQTSVDETVADLAHRLVALLEMLCDLTEVLRIFANTSDGRWCRWFQLNAGSTNERLSLRLFIAPVNVADMISSFLLGNEEGGKGVVLTSATLAVNREFDYIIREWGLSDAFDRDLVMTHLEDSPFDYAERCLLAVPTDLPEDRGRDFVEAASRLILDTLNVTRGRAFLLFTSWNELDTFWDKLSNKLSERGFLPLRQDPEGKRHVITDSFRAASAPVLFGVASFWEGVDIPGETLSCVIIVKLPFPVPTDPVLAARAKAYRLNRNSEFQKIFLPLMITRLRQGFGRLIRTEKDFGAVLILDSRLTTRNYRKQVLGSLPPAKFVEARSDEIVQTLQKCFRKWE